jgi:hypothetical protein
MWCKDKDVIPCWFDTDCVMTPWKSRIRYGTVVLRMKIPRKKISINRASLDAYKSQSDIN